MEVSILVFVELALDAWVPMGISGLSGGVSILVFVELALDGDSGGVKTWQTSSFNPCFRGTCS